MSLGPFICIGGYEVANLSRTTAYGCLFQDCPCAALDDTYDSPETDPAPWYSSAFASSADFFGFLPRTIEPSVPTSRDVQESVSIGSVIGAEKMPGRVVEVTGWMIAADAKSMYWGKRWLTEALRGGGCDAGDCQGDDLELLAYCDGSDEAFRTLVGAKLVDGPRFNPISADAEFIIDEAQFQFASRLPWLYAPVETVVDDETVEAGDTGCALVTTDEWFQGAALSIEVAASELAAATDLTITLTMSLDGTCPETRVPASVTYDIASLVRSGGITIDAARREVGFANPTSKRTEPGFSLLDWGGGSFCWPTIPACASVCVCLNNGGASDVTWRVESRAREL